MNVFSPKEVLETTKLLQRHIRDGAVLAGGKPIRADSRRPEYVRALAGESWAKLATAALAELKARRKNLNALVERRSSLHGLIGRFDAFAAAMEAANPRAADRPNWAAERVQIKAALRQRGMTAAKAETALARIEAIKAEDVREQTARSLLHSSANLDRMATETLSAICGAATALAVARFNEQALGGIALTDDSAPACEDAANRLKNAEKGLWTALRDQNQELALAQSAQLARTAAGLLMNVAVPHAASVCMRRQASSSQADGRLAMQCGDLLRSLLRAIALGYQASWDLGWPAGSEPARSWLRKAKDLTFPSMIKPPAAVSIASLTGNPAAADGKMASIEGKLSPVTIVHRGRKVISSAQVSDAAGRSVTIALPYIKLDSGGMAPGCHARVSGTWKTSSAEATGPALLVDRLNFGELAKASWSDWATGQIRGIFQAVPHGLAASWSWEPGMDGPGNPLRYGIWRAKTENKQP